MAPQSGRVRWHPSRKQPEIILNTKDTLSRWMSLGVQCHVSLQLINYGQLSNASVPHFRKERVHPFPTVHVEDSQPELSPGRYTNSTSC